MSFRARLTIAATAAVAVAIVLASCIAYVVVRHQLRGQVDDALESRLEAVSYEVLPGAIRITFPGLPLGGASGHVQIVDADGDVTLPPGEAVALPVSDRARQAASISGRGGGRLSSRIRWSTARTSACSPPRSGEVWPSRWPGRWTRSIDRFIVWASSSSL